MIVTVRESGTQFQFQSSWKFVLHIHCAYRFTIAHCVVAKFDTCCLFVYGVHEPLAFVFHPLNCALVLVNVFTSKYELLPYVNSESAMLHIHPLELYLTIYVIGVH